MTFDLDLKPFEAQSRRARQLAKRCSEPRDSEVYPMNSKTTPAELSPAFLPSGAIEGFAPRITLASVRWFRVREAQARLDNSPDGKR